MARIQNPDLTKTDLVLTNPCYNCELNRRYAELIGLPVITNLFTLMSGVSPSLFSLGK